MNRLTEGPSGDGRRSADLPPDRRTDRELDRRRLDRRGEPGPLDQRARRLPPDQPGHGGQGRGPARDRRGHLQEAGDRDVRRQRGALAPARTAPGGLRPAVRRAAHDRGTQARHRARLREEADRRVGGRPVSIIELDHVSKRFGDVTALDDVTVRLEENAIHGLLGRNGAGKTTLMQILTAQAFATSGTVRAFGQDPWENADVLDRTCFIREGQRYPDAFTVRHVLAAGRISFAGWDDDLATELVELFRLRPKQRVKKLSRGQLSAVGVVLGLASRAPLTIFDEPYLGLDAVA